MIYKQNGIELHNQDCLEGIKNIPDESIDVILTDPPYLYLKNQKLEREFDEVALFTEWKRVLKLGGFVILFGRGTSFYRWNTILSDLGFQFKEEIVWNKSQGSSPLLAMQRVHETVSIHTIGHGSINRVKVPYLEIKRYDLDSVIQDVNRLKSALKNTKSLNAVLDFLETNKIKFESENKNKHKLRGNCNDADRCARTLNSIANGMSERSIMGSYQKQGATISSDKVNIIESGIVDINKALNGMNEKSIIKCLRDHYTSIHPTQKPVRLIERLLALVSKEGDTVLDCFAGSFSGAEACINMQLKGIFYEIDEEYYNDGVERISKHEPQLAMF